MEQHLSLSGKNMLLRSLPRVDDLLAKPAIVSLCPDRGRRELTAAIREALALIRDEIREGRRISCTEQDIVETVKKRLALHETRSLRKVVNATGVIIHTNLGRSVLSPEAAQAVYRVARSYSTLEYDTDKGGRGSRYVHAEDLLCRLTGAQAAAVFNNNAAAVFIILSVFAQAKEVIVSRGQLVEIGGSFRIPDIIESSGARMVEVGTTNKTRLSDYQDALSEDTSLLLKVHPSNYHIVGFTEAPSTQDLRDLAHERDLILYEDLGSGALFSLETPGHQAEPTVASLVEGGVDLISFSGDKLLGGPQAGIIVGKKELVDRLRDSPLARVLRPDKMTLAALEETLRISLDEDRAFEEIPTLQMMRTSSDVLEKRAETLLEKIASLRVGKAAEITLVKEASCVGGGSLPDVSLDTVAISILPVAMSVNELNRCLIENERVPIIGRIKNDRLLLDMRTLVGEDDIDEIAAALTGCLLQ